MKGIIRTIIIILLSIRAIAPLFQSGIFPVHDNVQVERVIVMGKALAQGQFPVRWVSDLGYGYGYPIFNFYGPLPYTIGGMMSSLGVDPIIATKWMYAIGMVGAGLTMGALAAYAFGFWGGLLSAMLYIYAPYHAVQLYVRGSIGELWAYMWLPLIALGMLKTNDLRMKWSGVVIGSIGLIGTILSHTIYGFISVGIVCLMSIGGIAIRMIQKNTEVWRVAKKQAIMIGIALAISAFFWLPAFAEMGYTNVTKTIGGGADYKDHYICISQLWDSPWGFGGSTKGCVDGMSFKLGKIEWLAWCGILLACIWWWKNMKKYQIPILSGNIIALIGLIGVLEVSKPLWDTIPFASFIQYPYRLLPLLLLGSTFISGATMVLPIAGWMKKIIFVLICIGIAMTNIKLFIPQYIETPQSQTLASEEHVRFAASKISDEYLPKDIYIPKNKDERIIASIMDSDTIRVQDKKISDTNETFIIESFKNQELEIKKAYFPGWEYSVDGRKVAYSIDHGLPHIHLGTGVYTIQIRLQNSSIRFIANAISAIGLLLFIFYGKKAIS